MQYTKGRLINDGGEGYIYEAQEDASILLKIYKETDYSGSPIVTPELEHKLEYMKSNPPEPLVAEKLIAWPLELIRDEEGRLLGFTMHKLDIDEHILKINSYRHPKIDDEDEYESFPAVESRIVIAINLCYALHDLHKKGYIIGDFNHENIGVNRSTGQIYFMDCDSFHITDEIGEVHRTNVIMAGYLAPEIIQHCNKERAAGRPYSLDAVSLPSFTKQSDHFCLGIHLFKLLMNGVDPFRGIKSEATGSTASPFVGNEAIERDAYVFRSGNKPSALFCPPAESLPPNILELFNKAFIDSRTDPSMRPDETAWYNALLNYKNNELKECASTIKHRYYNSLQSCPYCAADDKYYKWYEGLFLDQYRDKPEVVVEKSPDELIKKSKRQTRVFHFLASVFLWVCATILYAGINIAQGRTKFTLDPSNWRGYEAIFIFAAIIECLLGYFFSGKELKVLNENIDLRELDPKNNESELRAYKRKLEINRRAALITIALLFIAALLMIVL